MRKRSMKSSCVNLHGNYIKQALQIVHLKILLAPKFNWIYLSH